MKRFSFSLERVLSFRRQQGELERGRLQELAGQREGLERQAGRMQQESRRWRSGCAALTEMKGAELAQAYHYAQALAEAGDHTLARAEEVETDRRRQLGVVIEARRRVRLLELLRTKRLTRHNRQANREEELAAAELHQARTRRQSAEESAP